MRRAVKASYKAELTRGPGQGPWKTVDDVELATLNDIPPTEHEAAYHQTETTHPVGIQ